MRLRAKDQIHISAVQPDSIRPGADFEVSDAMGKDLLAAHADKLEMAAEPAAEPDGAQEKSEPAPLNKMEQAPDNKAEPDDGKAAPRRKYSRHG